MRIVFVSNYFSHHQKSLSDDMNSRVDYNFIETGKMSEERKKLGWAMKDIPSYVIKNDDYESNREHYQELINNADIVIIGSAPYELIKKRIKNKKLTFIYSERIYKSGYEWYKIPPRIVLNFLRFGRYKNLYMLCASAYTSADFAKTFTFLNKTFKWGYFPDTKKYDDIDKIISEKNKRSILWCSRMIDWKHPELAIELADRLRKAGYEFTLTMIGNGELEEEIKKEIQDKGLADYINMIGAVGHEEVRSYMEKSEIFIFTSDKNEGWGAVLNESMNSACAVVASHSIGSVPFLIKDNENGLIYKDQDGCDLFKKVVWLMDNEDRRKDISKNAYLTIANEWNAKNASKKFLMLAESILCKNKNKIPSSGVCSRTEILSDRWYIKENK